MADVKGLAKRMTELEVQVKDLMNRRIGPLEELVARLTERLERVQRRSHDASHPPVPSLEQLASEQGVTPYDPKAPRPSFWPDDESVDEFNEVVRHLRRGQPLGG